MLSFLKGKKRPQHTQSEANPRSPSAVSAASSSHQMPEAEENHSAAGRPSLSEQPEDMPQRHPQKSSARSSRRGSQQGADDEAKIKAESERVSTASAAGSRQPRHSRDHDDVAGTTERKDPKPRTEKVEKEQKKKKRKHPERVEEDPTSAPPSKTSRVSEPAADRGEDPERSSRRERRTSAPMSAAERLLSQFPPAGTPAAAAAKRSASSRAKEDGQLIPQSPLSSPESGRVSTVRVQRGGSLALRSSPQPSPREGSPLDREIRNAFSSHRGREDNEENGRASSQRPLYVSKDEMFMHYLRHASPTSEAKEEGERISLQPRDTPSPQQAHSRSVSSRRRRKQTPACGSTAHAKTFASPQPLLTRPPPASSKPAARKAGAVAFSSSSSSSKGSSSDDSDRERDAHEKEGPDAAVRSRPSPRPAASAPPLVDARKVFKLSPDRVGEAEERNGKAVSRKELQKADRPITTAAVAEAPERREKLRAVASSQKTSHREVEDDRAQRGTRHTPDALAPQHPSAQQRVEEASRHPSRNRLRVYAAPSPRSNSTQVSFAGDVEGSRSSSGEDEAEQPPSPPLPPPPPPRPRRRTDEEEADITSSRPHSARTARRNEKAKVVEQPPRPRSPSSSSSSSTSHAQHENDDDAALTYTDMSTNLISHRFHHHRHEHVPHHTSLPAPAPGGTRRLLTAWTSYLQDHGPSILKNRHDETWMSRNNSPTRRGASSDLDVPVPVPNADVEDERASRQLVPRSQSAQEQYQVDTPQQPRALQNRLFEAEKEALLLRASLLMTYTLLAASEGGRKERQVYSSSAARQWQRSVDRYTGWSAQATSQRSNGQAQRHDGGLRERTTEEESARLVHNTPWPTLEARLAASVHTAAEELLSIASATRTAKGERASSGSGRDASAQRRNQKEKNSETVEDAEGRAVAELPPPRLLLRETPAHDMKGLPSLWYPPHRSDAVSPVTGLFSVWFSGSENELDDETESDEDDAVATMTRGSDVENSEYHHDRSFTDVSGDGDGGATPRRSRSGIFSVFSRSSSAGRSRGSKRSRSAPNSHPQQGQQHRRGRRRSSRASRSSLSARRGSWRRCFVVADDRGVRVYASERDYADFASERVLMAVPYDCLAYLIPDFVEAAFTLGDGGAEWNASSLSAVHARTISTVAATAISAEAQAPGRTTINNDDVEDALYVYFGFVHRQTPAMERKVAAASAAGPSFLQVLRSSSSSVAQYGGMQQSSGGAGSLPPLRFAPWRSLNFSASRKTSSRPHPPLVMRTQSRLARAEWVHFLAYKFNRHLYGLLFPTACAAMAQVGLRSSATQTAAVDATTYEAADGQRNGQTNARQEVAEKEREVKEEEEEGREEKHHHRRRRHSRRHTRSRSRDPPRRRSGDAYSVQSESTDEDVDYARDKYNDDDAFGDLNGGARAEKKRGRSRDTQHQQQQQRLRKDKKRSRYYRLENSPVSQLTSPTHLSAPPSPPKATNNFTRALQHAHHRTSSSSSSFEASDTRLHDPADGSMSGRASWVKTIADLRRTLQHREDQLRDLDREQAALTKTLRQRERQVQELQEGRAEVLAALQDAEQRQRTAEADHREEVRRLRRVADTAVMQRSASAAQAHNEEHEQQIQQQLQLQRHIKERDEEIRDALLDVEAEHRRASQLLLDELEELKRRYAADQAAWRAEQQTLETRCRFNEMQVEHLKDKASQEIRSMAHQVVRDLDTFHHEVRQGTEECVTSLLRDKQHAGSTTRATGAETAVVPATDARAIASLLLTFHNLKESVVDGELTVDEAEARLLYSGPTANQRGRRWELRHHETDALLRIQLELLSRAPGDPHRPKHAPPQQLQQQQQQKQRSRSATPHTAQSRRTSPSHTTPKPPPQPVEPPLPSERLLHYSDSLRGPDERRGAPPSRNSSRNFISPLLTAEENGVSASGGGRRFRGRTSGAGSAAMDAQTPLSAVLRHVNVSPRDTRASRLRQAAVERQIMERAAQEDA